MADQPSFPAGWYEDPDGTGGRRYYDGARWTENRTPPPEPGGATVQAVTEVKKQEADGVIITGYILAVLFPLVGFIIGLTQINKNRHGVWVVVVSVVAFVLWLGILAAGASDSTGGGYNY